MRDDDIYPCHNFFNDLTKPLSGMDEYYLLLFYVDVVTNPMPNPDVGYADLFW